MTDSVRDGVHNARIPSDHARHDRLLVARFAAEDCFPSEVADARALVAACADCAVMAADIRAIRSEMADLPIPRRDRDFRLSAEQAEALRGSPLDRLLRRLGSPGLAVLRPVAGAAMSLGLALAVVGAALPTPAAVEDSPAIFTEGLRGVEAPAAATPAAEAPAAEAPAEGEQLPGNGIVGGESDAGAGATPGAGEPESAVVPEGQLNATATGAAQPVGMRDLLIYSGLLLTALSLGLLIVVSIARRRWMDPLLR